MDTSGEERYIVPMPRIKGKNAIHPGYYGVDYSDEWIRQILHRLGHTYSTIKELSAWIRKFQVYTYNTPSKVRKRVDATLYFKTA